MYNQYLGSQRFVQLEGPDPGSSPGQQSPPPPNAGGKGKSDLLGDVAGGLSRMLGSLFRNFSLKDLDTGDILLVLIVLFLFLEGDNLEIVITLGLMLLLGLGENGEEDATPPPR